ncbi:hypothetical protein [Streptomyces griseoflavus]|uniref:hypothetical protein n=1 Tax=Streptomyces griseoflavus TaxID=35619 RepID=UPI00167EE574|nr:hypothetical protein [Streptomyces griseoflavus]
MSALADTCDQAQARAHRAPGHGRVMPKAAGETGTPLVSRHFMRRNTLEDVTYTTMNGPGLTFPRSGA